MFPTLIRRAAQEAKPASTEYIRQIRQLYPPKKVWPPDFKRLSPQEQFKYEKKYKRRLALASARPRWVKFTKLMQLFTITSFLIYAVLFMDYSSEKHPVHGHPFYAVRKSLWSLVGVEYEEPSPPKPTQKTHTQALPPVK